MEVRHRDVLQGAVAASRRGCCAACAVRVAPRCSPGLDSPPGSPRHTGDPVHSSRPGGACRPSRPVPEGCAGRPAGTRGVKGVQQTAPVPSCCPFRLLSIPSPGAAAAATATTLPPAPWFSGPPGPILPVCRPPVLRPPTRSRRTCARTNTDTHARSHTHARTHTNTHTHTHTHTHTTRSGPDPETLPPHRPPPSLSPAAVRRVVQDAGAARRRHGLGARRAGESGPEGLAEIRAPLPRAHARTRPLPLPQLPLRALPLPPSHPPASLPRTLLPPSLPPSLPLSLSPSHLSSLHPFLPPSSPPPLPLSLPPSVPLPPSIPIRLSVPSSRCPSLSPAQGGGAYTGTYVHTHALGTHARCTAQPDLSAFLPLSLYHPTRVLHPSVPPPSKPLSRCGRVHRRGKARPSSTVATAAPRPPRAERDSRRRDRGRPRLRLRRAPGPAAAASPLGRMARPRAALGTWGGSSDPRRAPSWKRGDESMTPPRQEPTEGGRAPRHAMAWWDDRCACRGWIGVRGGGPGARRPAVDGGVRRGRGGGSLRTLPQDDCTSASSGWTAHSRWPAIATSVF